LICILTISISSGKLLPNCFLCKKWDWPNCTHVFICAPIKTC